MSNFANHYDYPHKSKKMDEATRLSLRRTGFALMIITALVLGNDAYHLFSNTMNVKLSGLLDVWKQIDQHSLSALQGFIVGNISSSVWYSIVMPLLSTPIALLMGIPAFIMLRSGSAEIEARAPTLRQLETEKLGLARSSSRVRR